jgi:hypothetical protein
MSEQIEKIKSEIQEHFKEVVKFQQSHINSGDDIFKPSAVTDKMTD